MRRLGFLLVVAGCASQPDPGSLEAIKRKQVADLTWECIRYNLDRNPGISTVFPEVISQVNLHCVNWANRTAYGRGKKK